MLHNYKYRYIKYVQYLCIYINAVVNILVQYVQEEVQELLYKMGQDFLDIQYVVCIDIFFLFYIQRS